MFVFRIILFVLVLKCLVSFVYTESTSLQEKSSASESNEGQTVNSTKSNNITSVKTQGIATIIDEGGEKFVPVVSTTTKPNIGKGTTEQPDINNNTQTEIPRHHGREGELIPTDVKKNNSSNETKVDQNVQNNHIGREGEVTVIPEKKNVTFADVNNKTSTPMSDYVTKPITENPITNDSQSTKSSHSRIVPKKGVNFTEIVTSDPINETSSSTEMETSLTTAKTTIKPTTAPEKVHKPTLTTGSEDKGDALGKQKTSNSTPKVPTIEYYQKKKEEDNKRSNFIIPIVAVILSVPIVAIILNITYKRCKEWWSHRHYSRMDFLIDGMYNN